MSDPIFWMPNPNEHIVITDTIELTTQEQSLRFWYKTVTPDGVVHRDYGGVLYQPKLERGDWFKVNGGHYPPVNYKAGRACIRILISMKKKPALMKRWMDEVTKMINATKRPEANIVPKSIRLSSRSLYIPIKFINGKALIVPGECSAISVSQQLLGEIQVKPNRFQQLES